MGGDKYLYNQVHLRMAEFMLPDGDSRNTVTAG